MGQVPGSEGHITQPCESVGKAEDSSLSKITRYGSSTSGSVRVGRNEDISLYMTQCEESAS